MMVGVLEDHIPWADLFEASSIPMSVIDPHGRQVSWNAAYEEFLGYTSTELAQIDVGQVTRPEDAEWTRSYLMRLLSGEVERFETDKWYVRKDGSHVKAHLSARPLIDEHGRCQFLIGTLMPIDDVNARIDASVALRLLEFTGDAITLVDREGEIVFTKAQLTELAGYPTSFWAGRRISDLFPPGELERMLADHPDFLSTPGAEFVTEIELRAGDGSAHLSALRAVNCIDDPLLDGYVLVTRDVTAQRAAVAELARRQQTAEAVADAQTRLLATVSHELRNPLHAVRGIAELLTDEELPPRAADLASSLARQLAGLSRVTQDLLDAARLDAGSIAIEAVPTEVATLVDDVIDLGRAAAGPTSLVISRRVARGVPDWILADPGRLRQVLTNLVGNAVKFTEQGLVQLVVRIEDSDTIVFSVADTGVGIPIDEQDEVLHPFTVASTAGDARGAGLGLSIVQRLVTAMDGTIALSSEVGAGTRFDVRLPLRAAAAPSLDARAVIPSGARVLVVEDNPVNQQLARSQLGRLGVDVTVVERGEDGLELLTTSPPGTFDVVLMDQQLPGWSGTETTQRIRQSGGHLAEMPIVGISASASASDRDRFLTAGMDGFVPKPASLDDVAAAIGAALAPSPGGVDGTADTAVDDDAGAPPIDDVTVVDLDVLHRLGAELGSDAVVHGLVSTFLGELDERVDALTGDDAVAARRAAHTLKSSARLLGAQALAELCAVLESADAAPTDRNHEIVALADDTRREFRRWQAAGVR